MTVAELITHVKAHGFTDADNTVLEEILWEVMNDVNKETPPYLKTTATLTFNASSATPTAQPTRLSKVVSLVNTSTGTILQPTTWERLVKQFPTQLTTEGEPRFYYFLANSQLGVYPEPESSATMHIVFFQHQARLESDDSTEANILLPPRYHRALLASGVLRELYLQEDDIEMSTIWGDRFDEKYAEFLADMFTQQDDRPPMVDPFDYDDYAEELWA